MLGVEQKPLGRGGVGSGQPKCGGGERGGGTGERGVAQTYTDTLDAKDEATLIFQCLCLAILRSLCCSGAAGQYGGSTCEPCNIGWFMYVAEKQCNSK